MDNNTNAPQSQARIMPDLQSSLLCDDVRQERNGKFMLIGLFDVIGVPNYPAIFHKLCVINRWCCGSGSFLQHSRILQPDGTTIMMESKAVEVKLPDSEATATSVEIFMNAQFNTEGTYWVEILLDGDLKLRYPLKAVRVTTPQARDA
jgi:hypothetical protein